MKFILFISVWLTVGGLVCDSVSDYERLCRTDHLPRWLIMVIWPVAGPVASVVAMFTEPPDCR